MANPFVAEIRIFGFNFAPTGWAACDGALLPISQNTALFSLIGTFYGGDGRSNFALPNLQSSFAIGQGNGPGLTGHVMGETGGEPRVTLLASEMPSHTHGLFATGTATTGSAAGAALSSAGAFAYRTPGVTAAMAPVALTGAGGSQPHENRQPYLGLMFCIAMQGVFPPRS